MTASLPEKILAIDLRLAEANIAHAFGGALALAYYAEPRATIDIDVNLFVAPTSTRRLPRRSRRSTSRPRGRRPRWSATGSAARGGIAHHSRPLLRLRRDPQGDATSGAPVALFGEDRLPILAPEHLVVCKAIFDRPKDWLDIEQVLVCVDDLDTEEMSAWLARMVGDGDERAQRFQQALALRAG